MASDIRKIPISRLVEDTHHYHREMPGEQLARLQMSMRAIGVLHPVIVRRLPGRKARYAVVAGWGRVLAAKSNGESTIECKTIKNCGDELADRISFEENFARFTIDENDDYCRTAVAKYYVEKEVKALAAMPTNTVKRARGRPASPERAGIKKAAEFMKVSTKTIERSVKKAQTAATNNDTAEENGESTIAELGESKALAKVEQARIDVVQEFAQFVRALDRFRKQHLLPLVVRLPNASTDELADVNSADIDHLTSFIAAMQKLRSCLPEGSDTDRETEAEREENDELESDAETP